MEADGEGGTDGSGKPMTLAEEKALLKQKLLAQPPKKKRVKKEKRD
jgi:hypothetical protein